MDIDQSQHRSFFQDDGTPRTGVVHLLVVREPEERKRVLDEAELTVGEGVVGDRWSSAGDPEKHSQVTLMDSRVVQAIAGKLVPTSGDNIIADFSLSEDEVAVGQRLRVGDVLLEVTPEPHNGCKKFAERFGIAALRWVNQEPELRRRGVHARVVRSGVIRKGDVVVAEKSQSEPTLG